MRRANSTIFWVYLLNDWRRILWLAAILLLAGCRGQGDLVVEKPGLHFEDPDGRLSPAQILSRFQSGKFGPTPEPGYTSSAHWLTFRLTRPGTEPVLLVEPENLAMVSFAVFVLDDAGRRLIPLNPVRPGLFRTQVSVPEAGAQIFIRLTSREAPDYLIRVSDPLGAKIRDRVENTLLAAVLGMVLALVLYNAFLYLTLRDSAYIYYVLFACVNALISNLAVNFPWNLLDVTGVELRIWGSVFRPLAPLTAFLFGYAFPQVKDHPRIASTYKAYMACLVGLIIWYLAVPEQWLVIVELTDPVFLLGLLILIFTSVWIWLRADYRPALYFFLAQSFFLSGILIYIACTYGVLDISNPLIKHAHIILQAVEMLLMSMALAWRFRLAEAAGIERDRKRDLNRKLTTLIRMAVHDLRSPLSVLKIGAESFRSHPELMHRSVQKIKDILHLTGVKEAYDVGSWTPVMSKVRVAELLDEAVDHFSFQAREKGVTLRVEDHTRAGDMVMVDRPTFIHQVLGNLISNAVKFSRKGAEVVVSANAYGGRVSITVSDRGEGIEERILQNMFNDEHAGSRTGTAGERGIGYGMQLVKRFTEAIGGSLSVVTRPARSYGENSGTEVTVTAPTPETWTPVTMHPVAPASGLHRSAHGRDLLFCGALLLFWLICVARVLLIDSPG